MLEGLFTVDALVTFLILTALETVLGFDNLLYISIESKKVDPAREAWVGGLAAELDAGDTGAYVGFLAADEQERVRSAYPGATWDRLTEIKARYDPDNVFRVNHNIPPA